MNVVDCCSLSFFGILLDFRVFTSKLLGTFWHKGINLFVYMFSLL